MGMTCERDGNSSWADDRIAGRRNDIWEDTRYAVFVLEHEGAGTG